MMNKQKSGSNILQIIIIILLSIVVVIGVMLLLKDNNQNNNINSESGSNNSEVKKLSDNDENVLKLKKIIGVVDIYTGATGIKKLNNYFASAKTVDLNQTSQTFKNSLIYLMYRDELESHNNNSNIIYISEEKLKNYYGQWFDISTYHQANINWFGDFMTQYDDNTKQYYYQSGVGEIYGPGYYEPHSIYAYAEQDGNKINVYAYYYVINLLFDVKNTDNYYSDFNHTNLIATNTYSNDADKWSETLVVNNYKDKLGLHKYVFEKNDYNEYKFVKFETVK